MGFNEIMKKANYYSESNEKKGWSLEINSEIANSNPHIITPELAQEIKMNIQPRESFPKQKLIENYDEKKKKFENDLDQIIMTKQETYGRGMTA